MLLAGEASADKVVRSPDAGGGVTWLQAKSDKDWTRADEIRKEVESRGFVIKDVKDGPSELVRK
jgi:cysteinyl-tRNA synthetase